MGHKVVISTATFILFITGLLLGYVISQLVLGFLHLNLLTFLGTLSLIIIFAIVYYALFWDLRKQQSQSPSFPNGEPSNSPQSEVTGVISNIPNNPPPKAINPSLENKLVSLLAGDIDAAERLVAKVKQEYPGMPENWYWERAIADLERDRR
ncbi:ABC transporter permease [Calothrix rhizosoleniae]|uniref:ABC transporter permease n=1 Tax=Calothrix rhizosoleniae TaxID=888997 RepID=UPI000B4A08E3|nr:ABC transporter permease [Calothrix rhizosoleniae]